MAPRKPALLRRCVRCFGLMCVYVLTNRNSVYTGEVLLNTHRLALVRHYKSESFLVRVVSVVRCKRKQHLNGAGNPTPARETAFSNHVSCRNRMTATYRQLAGYTQRLASRAPAGIAWHELLHEIASSSLVRLRNPGLQRSPGSLDTCGPCALQYLSLC